MLILKTLQGCATRICQSSVGIAGVESNLISQRSYSYRVDCVGTRLVIAGENGIQFRTRTYIYLVGLEQP